MDSYNPFHTGSFACFFKAFSAPLHNRMRGCGGSFPISIETLLSAPDNVAKKEITTTSTIPFAFWTILNFNEFYRAPTPKAAESPQACGHCLSAASPSAIGDCRAEAYAPAYPGTKTRRHEVAPKPDPKPPGFRPAAGFSRRSAPGFSFPGYDRIRKRFSVFGNLRGADAQFGRPGTPALNVPTAIPADQSHPFPNAVFEPGNKKLIVTVVFHGIRSQAGGRCDRDEPRQPSRFFIH